jgi:type III secretory pathway component EscT
MISVFRVSEQAKQEIIMQQAARMCLLATAFLIGLFFDPESGGAPKLQSVFNEIYHSHAKR